LDVDVSSSAHFNNLKPMNTQKPIELSFFLKKTQVLFNTTLTNVILSWKWLWSKILLCRPNV